MSRYRGCRSYSVARRYTTKSTILTEIANPFSHHPRYQTCLPQKNAICGARLVRAPALKTENFIVRKRKSGFTNTPFSLFSKVFCPWDSFTTIYNGNLCQTSSLEFEVRNSNNDPHLKDRPLSVKLPELSIQNRRSLKSATDKITYNQITIPGAGLWA